MANVQKYFEQFHDTIRTDYEMNRTLREKKDIILQLLRKRLQEAKRPGFDELLQGSYSTPIRMGVRPIAALQFDIDIGLRFAFDDKEFSASEVRKWIYDAVNGHTDSVVEMGPCIRVGYTYCISSNDSASVLSYQELSTSIQCGEAMARRRKEERRAGSASRGMVRRWGRFSSRVRHRVVPDRERVPDRRHFSGSAVDVCSDAPAGAQWAERAADGGVVDVSRVVYLSPADK